MVDFSAKCGVGREYESFFFTHTHTMVLRLLNGLKKCSKGYKETWEAPIGIKEKKGPF